MRGGIFPLRNRFAMVAMRPLFFLAVAVLLVIGQASAEQKDIDCVDQCVVEVMAVIKQCRDTVGKDNPSACLFDESKVPDECRVKCEEAQRMTEDELKDRLEELQKASPR